MSSSVKTREQVLTSKSQPRGRKGSTGQVDDTQQPGRRPRLPTYSDKAATRSKAKRTGGWGHTIELSYGEVQHCFEIQTAAARNRTPLNKFLTVRGRDGEGLSESKRSLSNFISRVGQALHRHGHQHIGFTTFERERGHDYIHAHHLFHVPREARNIVQRFADGDVVHLRQAHKKQCGYLTKQRQQMSPEYEKAIAGVLFHRQPGDYIPGTRLSVTKAAKALVPDIEKPPRRVTTSPQKAVILPNRVCSIRHCNINSLVEHDRPAAQLALPLVAPPIDLFAAAETKRKAAGIPQHRLAKQLGIRQPQYANALRGHDRLSPWVRNRLIDYVKERLAA